MESCVICEKRRPRRYCPGVRGDICAVCCGEEREVTVSCPLDCPHLQDARRHEKQPELDPEKIPHRDIRVSDDFLSANEPLLVSAANALAGAALDTQGAVDTDVREALDSMIRTQRTLESGLYYESRPSNLIAATVADRLRQAIEELRRGLAERTGSHSIRDKDVLGVLVFLARLEFQANNGRTRGRAFIDLLRRNFLPEETRGASSLIVPGA
ncbi:MAG: hypothetical protein KIT09_00085 [Bryobacteraceae bacterium]|nr:hypothetical protein [Bryobacteraceae bacterium]